LALSAGSCRPGKEFGTITSPYAQLRPPRRDATWARREGVPLDRIAAVLGYADLRMTLRTHAHIRPEDLAAPLDVLAGVERMA
jgi:hypothetical protein